MKLKIQGCQIRVIQYSNDQNSSIYIFSSTRDNWCTHVSTAERTIIKKLNIQLESNTSMFGESFFNESVFELQNTPQHSK